MRQSSFQRIDIPLSRDIESKYDDIKEVLDNIQSVLTVSTAIGDGTFASAIEVTTDPLKSNINTLGPIATEIANVASIASELQIVASIYENVSTVADNVEAVNTVSTYIEDVSTVANSIDDVSLVAASIANVNTVATDIDNVNIVGSNIANVNTTANNIDDVGTVAADIDNVNTVGQNITAVNRYADTYFTGDTAPVSPTIGDLWFDTSSSIMRVYDGNGFINAGSSVNGTSSRNTYIATEGQTTFSAIYDTGYVDVYLNGIKLQSTSDFTATDGNTIVLATGATAGSVVDIVAYGTFEIADTYTKAEADALFEPIDSTILKDADIGVTVQEYDADTAKLDEAQTFTAPQRGTITVDNDGSFDLNVTNNFSCTPTALFTLTFTNISAGQSGQILLDNSGGYVITADTNTKVDANFLSTVSTAGVYVLGYFSNGTNVYVYNSGSLL